MESKPKILMIWTANSNEQIGGVGQYRIKSPCLALKELGYDVDIVSGFELVDKFRKNVYESELLDVYTNILRTYDVVWMKHTDNEMAISALFGLKKRFKCKIIWDFDDDLFHVRESQPAYKEYYPGSRKKAVVMTAMSMCDAITVSTLPLKNTIKKILNESCNVDIPIFICPNFLNKEEWNNVKYYPSNSPTIGYYGSTTHNDDLAIVLPAINKLLLKYPTLRFQLLGTVDAKGAIEMFKSFDKSVLDRCGLAPGLKGWDGFPALLQRVNWDISIAPLVDDQFNRCKSHIKWLESSMKGIPTVVSDVYPYTEDVLKTKTVINGKTGFICKPNEWEKVLSKLISNPELRKTVGDQAKQFVLENWMKESQIKHWKVAIDKVIKM